MSTAKTERFVLTITKCWSGTAETDRRRHKRFGLQSLPARLVLIENGEQSLRLAPCSLLNVSYGGMCFSTDQPLQARDECRFLIEFAAPFADLVLVRARILWTQPDQGDMYRVGADFLESSKGWLGSDEDGRE